MGMGGGQTDYFKQGETLLVDLPIRNHEEAINRGKEDLDVQFGTQ